ncbi:MAG: hypothetical protein ACTSQE_07240 [Candidatus Heimdallarchaeaceae archaeon]
MQKEKEFLTCLGEIMCGDGAYERIRDLCFLGSRFSGTESEKKAQEYIKSFVENLGLKVKEWSFTYQGWKRVSCIFELIEPINKEIPAISLVLAPSTEEGGVEGDCVRKRRIKDRVRANKRKNSG